MLWWALRLTLDTLLFTEIIIFHKFSFVVFFFLLQEQMQAKSELSASNKSAQNSVDRLIKFIELVQSL